ncbi:OLC1v1013265C1 [Oldenlandia corymbosa var. corymbosa]|uniref:OLC1v1013265C1 n=1 Tax=Oldenlandia corymbosa var. corymbosa TaxID=529605 RepID=A0AAV1E1F8_OLDCO|nr:OLC1v1013265C1 [Oldenlandia corymbosa var. corymbosa]
MQNFYVSKPERTIVELHDVKAKAAETEEQYLLRKNFPELRYPSERASRGDDKAVPDESCGRNDKCGSAGPRTSKGFGKDGSDSRTVKDRLSWPDRSQGVSFGRSAQPFLLLINSATARMIRPSQVSDNLWHRIEHPRFPTPMSASNGMTRTQRRRWQHQRAGRYQDLKQKREFQQSPYSASGRHDRVTKQWRVKEQDSMDVNMVYVLRKEYAARQAIAELLKVKVNESGKTPMPNVNPRSKEVLGIKVTTDEDSLTVVISMPESMSTIHVKPLYVQALLNVVPINRILVKNGATVNIMHTSTLRRLGIQQLDLVPIVIAVSGFTGDVISTWGILPVIVELGSQAV